MGVFNGNSIYNDGGAGGGGGYNDGGDLTPADYIEIENNSFYKLEGNDAANLNFVIDGESGVLNSIVEISTNVDSTINVYVNRDGLLYKLSTIDSLIYQNKSYRLYINGDTYYINEINQSISISKAIINNNLVDVIVYGNYIITQDLGWFNYNEFEDLVNTSGWSKVSYQVLSTIKNDLGQDSMRSTSGWNTPQGTNTSGLNFYPYGRKQGGDMNGVGYFNYSWCKDDYQPGFNYFYIGYSDFGVGQWSTENDLYFRGRLMKTIN